MDRVVVEILSLKLPLLPDQRFTVDLRLESPSAKLQLLQGWPRDFSVQPDAQQPLAGVGAKGTASLGGELFLFRDPWHACSCTRIGKLTPIWSWLP